MRNPNENASEEKNSTLTGTSTHETGQQSPAPAQNECTDGVKSDVSNHNVGKTDKSQYPYPPEFVTFTRQLREMSDWLYQYGNKNFERNSVADDVLKCVCDDISDAARGIGDLAGIKFAHSYFTLNPRSHE